MTNLEENCWSENVCQNCGSKHQDGSQILTIGVMSKIASRASAVRSKSVSRGHCLRKTLVMLWDSVTTDFRDAYRPEKHYMRGPGPKSI